MNRKPFDCFLHDCVTPNLFLIRIFILSGRHVVSMDLFLFHSLEIRYPSCLTRSPNLMQFISLFPNQTIEIINFKGRRMERWSTVNPEVDRRVSDSFHKVSIPKGKRFDFLFPFLFLLNFGRNFHIFPFFPL